MIKIEEGFHGGKYARRYELAKVGDMSHNHRHTFDHHTVLCSRFRVYEEGEATAEYGPGTLLVIEAGKLHQFEALEDRAVYICTHQLRKPDGSILTDEEAAGMTLNQLRVLTGELTEQREVA